MIVKQKLTEESSNHYSYLSFVVHIRSSLERHESLACCTLPGVLDQEIVLLLQHHHMMNTRQTPLMCVCVYMYMCVYIYIIYICMYIYIGFRISVGFSLGLAKTEGAS